MDPFTRQMLEILACVAGGSLIALAIVLVTMRPRKNPRPDRG